MGGGSTLKRLQLICVLSVKRPVLRVDCTITKLQITDAGGKCLYHLWKLSGSVSKLSQILCSSNNFWPIEFWNDSGHELGIEIDLAFFHIARLQNKIRFYEMQFFCGQQVFTVHGKQGRYTTCFKTCGTRVRVSDNLDKNDNLMTANSVIMT